MDMAAVKGGGEDLEVFFAANLGRLVVLLFSLAWLGVCHREPGLEPCDVKERSRRLEGAAWKCRNPLLRG